MVCAVIYRFGFVSFILTVTTGSGCFRQNSGTLFRTQWFETTGNIDGLLENFHSLATCNNDTDRQIHSVMQTLYRSNSTGL